MVLKYYVLENNNIKDAKDIHDALSHGTGLAGTTAVLFDGKKIDGSKGLYGKDKFKASKTGVRETHEILWTNLTPWVYTISDITKAEVITEHKINKFVPNRIGGEIKALTAPTKAELFVAKPHGQKEVRVSKKASSTAVVTEALYLSQVEYGSVQDIVLNYEDGDGDQLAGWACYPKMEKSRQLSIPTLNKLHDLFVTGNEDKARRITASRARSIIIQEIASRDWYEQSILTGVKIKIFFALTTKKQKQLIDTLELKQLSIPTLTKLNALFERGINDESTTMTASYAHSIVSNEMTTGNCYELSILTESRINTFFALTAKKQRMLIVSLEKELLQHISAEVEGMTDIDIEFEQLQNNVENVSAQALEREDVDEVEDL